MALVAHHISADGASMAPLARDLVMAYSARSQGRSPEWNPLPLQYVDYALWHRELLGDESDPGSVAATQLNYWGDRLRGMADLLELPTDHPRPPKASLAGNRVTLDIDQDVAQGLETISRSTGSSIFMVTHAVLAAFLSRLTGSSDIAIATPFAGRGGAVLDDLVGMFVNTLVLRTPVDPATSFRELVAIAHDVDLEAYAHCDVPFDAVVERLNPVRSTAYSPLAQVMLAFENNPLPTVELSGLTVSEYTSGMRAAKYDLKLTVVENRDDSGTLESLSTEFVYAVDLFDRETVVGFATRFLRMVEVVVADPEAVIGDIDLWRDSSPADGGESVHADLPALIAAAADRFPERTALRTGESIIRFGELATHLQLLTDSLNGSGLAADAIVITAISSVFPDILSSPGGVDWDDVLNELAVEATKSTDSHAVLNG
jgi:hypothetical protein